MSYWWDRGLGGAVLLLCFVLFPAIALVVRWKLRLADAKLTEIIRLVRFAAAEAERAEMEAAVFASASNPPASVVIVGGAVMSNCAVCHNPTTSRCARCKVVKYWLVAFF
ncbi:Ubiquitin carboxyl-terminal hydrolase 17 [Dendrobium catenatum]|uniref:Ubiquitin carboxyl-terminal hydrolase 17 n=1 Tax=Dendrobium catenatum TaxID=906689 RepID=A0A2I0VR52_9ASPA|nr:Ubiquitin carboxyl-terminal hydrolase 17 [Dendrobium catenatum]